ncbi:hypothetical protein ACLVWU_09245 [Bdellovibrio sp. HCB290]|uniref:hypothetical protein n=1 Tax=Bdellovibrio sp. HCB290 TaxID=3394356 RepID=UPI0039B38403
MRFAVLFLVLFAANKSFASIKYVLMMSPLSASEMPYEKADKYCDKLKSPCEVTNTSVACDDKVFEKWAVPAKEELDHLTTKKHSEKFVWTKSRLFAVGDGLPVVYRFSKGGSYGPSFGKNHRVRCIKWTTI